MRPLAERRRRRRRPPSSSSVPTRTTVFPALEARDGVLGEVETALAVTEVPDLVRDAVVALDDVNVYFEVEPERVEEAGLPGVVSLPGEGRLDALAGEALELADLRGRDARVARVGDDGLPDGVLGALFESACARGTSSSVRSPTGMTSVTVSSPRVSVPVLSIATAST